MAAPNEFPIVQATNNQYPQLLKTNSESSVLEFMMTLGPRLAAKDAGWGYLTKTAGEAHLTLPNGQHIATDAFIYKPTQQVVDVIANVLAATPASPTWQEVPKRAGNEWYPISGTPTEPPIPPVDNNMQQQIDALNARVAALETELQNAVKWGDRQALESANGMVLCAEGGGPEEERQEYNLTARSKDSIGPWESWTIHKGGG